MVSQYHTSFLTYVHVTYVHVYTMLITSIQSRLFEIIL